MSARTMATQGKIIQFTQFTQITQGEITQFCLLMILKPKNMNLLLQLVDVMQFTSFCREFGFVMIYTLVGVKFVSPKTSVCKIIDI